jgi:hypothetical protein
MSSLSVALSFRHRPASVGLVNLVDDIVQCTGLMTVETAWPEVACQVVTVAKSSARGREGKGVVPMKMHAIIPRCQPCDRVMGLLDNPVRSEMARRTTDPGYASIEVRTMAVGTQIDTDFRVC